MKKLAMLAVLFGLMWADADVARAVQCGLGCPAGYHAESYYCDAACGLCVNVCSQASMCQPNGTSFDTCGSCPTGYRTDYRWCNFSCVVCSGGCGGLTNASHCTKI
jgi:hypothetical protein